MYGTIKVLGIRAGRLRLAVTRSSLTGRWPRGESAVRYSKPGTPEPRAKVVHSLVVASAESLVIGIARPSRLGSPNTSGIDGGRGTAETDPNRLPPQRRKPAGQIGCR